MSKNPGFRNRFLVIVTSVFLAWNLTNLAQVEGQAVTAGILGTVTDTSGAAIPGTTIQVKNAGTGITQTSASDEQGRYRVPDLGIGEYEVQASKAGFQTVIHRNIVLTVGSQPVVDFSLPVGAAQETVTVESQVSQVDVTSAAIGALVEGTQIRDLPLNGRNYTSLLTLAPGVQTGAQAAQSAGIGFFGRGSQYSVAGSRLYGQAYLLDNTDVAGFFGHGVGSGATGGSLGVEAIAEFQALTATYGAQFGGNGAVLNAVSKSGTNEFHGSVYEFLRNRVLDARDYFDLPTQPKWFSQSSVSPEPVRRQPGRSCYERQGVFLRELRRFATTQGNQQSGLYSRRECTEWILTVRYRGFCRPLQPGQWIGECRLREFERPRYVVALPADDEHVGQWSRLLHRPGESDRASELPAGAVR